jgi:2-polyprenyl-3-methyl-5-hydroxy-6-metoxy-1,4-benzoquinol methylase
MPVNKIFQNRGNMPADLLKPEIHDITMRFATFRAGMNYRQALEKLESGSSIKIEGTYSTAVSIYSWIKKKINMNNHAADYISARKLKQRLNLLTNRLFIRIKDHKVDLHNAPEIAWLKIFYPGRNDFLISLPDMLGLNGSWQWYSRGIDYPLISTRLHPFYGVYFPSRKEHLILFDNWLSGNKRDFNNGLDIGTGCGILSLIMARHGITNIHATDINPNAVYSTSMEFERLKIPYPITVERASFFGSLSEVRGLTVFNPPWIPGTAFNMIDRGIYYEAGFFRNFFDQAKEKMSPGSTLALIFSNFAIEAGITDHNPVEKEISLNKNFRVKEKLSSKIHERTAKKGKSWLNHIREKEITELWIIERRS